MISKDQLTRSKVCQQCQHFRRHYVRQGRRRYIPIMVGHCVYPRLKGRAADTPACAHFVPCIRHSHLQHCRAWR